MNPFKNAVVCLVILLSLFYSKAYGNEASISPKKPANVGKCALPTMKAGNTSIIGKP